MATVGAGNPTLSDWAKRVQDDKIAAIVEILTDTNEILADMTLMEGNLHTGHKTTIRSGLPSSTWRQLNYGVQPNKSRTVQVTDSCGMLEQYAEVDKDLADLNGNTNEFRLSEDRAHIEGMNQDLASALFYGNTETDPEKIMGLAPRFDSLSAANATNVISGGGSGSDNTSIWLVVWGPNTCHAIFPKGKKAGLQVMDKGQQTLEDAAGGKYEGYRTHYKWDIGLTVRDWRYVVRICNIDVSNLTKDASGSSADIIDLMIQAVHKLPSKGMGRPSFYANETILSILDRQSYNQSGLQLGYGKDLHGQEVLKFRGIPIRKCDAILGTEATVS